MASCKRVLDAGTLELRHDERDAVDEQHRVRDDVAAPAGQFDFELVDDEEIVVLRVLEIDEPYRLVAGPVPNPAGPSATVPLSSSAVADWLISISRWPVGLLQVADGARDALLIQPRLAVAQIQLSQRRREPAFEQHLAEVGALREIGHVLVALDPLPAHRLELLAERALDQVVFPLDLAHAWASSAKIDSGAQTRPVKRSDMRPNLARVSFERNRLLGHKRRFNLQHHSDNPPLFGDLWCCDEKQLHFANIKMLLRQAALSLQNLVLAERRVHPERQELRVDFRLRARNNQINAVAAIQRLRYYACSPRITCPYRNQVTSSQYTFAEEQVGLRRDVHKIPEVNPILLNVRRAKRWHAIFDIVLSRPHDDPDKYLVAKTITRPDFPPFGNLTERGMLELTGLGDRVAELAVLVEATHEEIVKHADANSSSFAITASVLKIALSMESRINPMWYAHLAAADGFGAVARRPR